MTETGNNSTFPEITATNLEGTEYHLPGDFHGELNLLFIAFQRWHQDDVFTWLPFVQELRKHLPILGYHLLPVISAGNPIFRIWLDNALKAGIADRPTREATITLQLDKSAFCAALGISDEEDIHVLLTDKAGHIIWRTQGRIDETKRTSLSQFLQTGKI